MEHKKTNPFYLSKAWRELRAYCLARDHYLCVPCMRRKRITPAAMVHHKKPIEEYPELALNPDNCESQCAACHNREHPEKAGGKVEREYRARVVRG